MENKFIKIFVVLLIILFFHPISLMVKGETCAFESYGLDYRCPKSGRNSLLSCPDGGIMDLEHSVCDELDQYQENDNGYEKIYGGICYAQSFLPSRGILTQLEIKIGIDYTLPWFIEFFVNLAQLFPFLQPVTDNLRARFLNTPSSLLVCLYDSENQLPGKPFFTEEILFADLSMSNSWYSLSLDGKEIVSNRAYFIVLQAYGGDENTHYTWSFGSNNPYGLGTAMTSTDDGVTWTRLSSTDFCFRIYSESNGEEPDGEINRWGVICGVDGDQNTVGDDSAVKIYNALCSHGWDKSHLRLLKNEMGTKKEILDALSWMDTQEDADDIVLFYFCGHGAGGQGIWVYPYPSGFLSGWELDEAVSEFGSNSLVLIFDSCNSGGLQYYLGKDTRVLLMSSRSDEFSQGDLEIGSGYFTYYLVMGLGVNVADSNHDKWISAEEVFYYAEPKTTLKASYPQHPQLYDAWPSSENNQGELKLVPI